MDFEWWVAGSDRGNSDWSFTWDGPSFAKATEGKENRLIQAENGSIKVEHAYDHMSRRVGKASYAWDTDHWSLDTERTFLYDGWAMIREEVSGSATVATNYYIYGLDLSGTMQGAGTIGGLLVALFDGVPVFYAYDANGNVTELVSLDGSTAAAYEYDPFGNTTSATGSLAAVNPYRFSTKYTDDEIGLVYYGYRYYSPELGRWVNRDPIEELGGVNLYAFVFNAPSMLVDALGLSPPSHFGCDELEQVLARIDALLSPNGGVGAGILNNCDADRVPDVIGTFEQPETAITIASAAAMARVTEPYLRVEPLMGRGAHGGFGLEHVGSPHWANVGLRATGQVLAGVSIGVNTGRAITDFRQGNTGRGIQRSGSAVGSALSFVPVYGQLFAATTLTGELLAQGITTWSEIRNTRVMNEARSRACDAFLEMRDGLLSEQEAIRSRMGELCCGSR